MKKNIGFLGFAAVAFVAGLFISGSLAMAVSSAPEGVRQASVPAPVPQELPTSIDIPGELETPVLVLPKVKITAWGAKRTPVATAPTSPQKWVCQEPRVLLAGYGTKSAKVTHVRECSWQ